MTHAQLEAIRAKRAEAAAARERLIEGRLTGRERQVEEAHLVALHGEILALEAAADAPSPHPKASEIAALTPAEAAKRAAELRERPEYQSASARDKDGNLLMTTGQREALLAEHVELIRRAAEPADAA